MTKSDGIIIKKKLLAQCQEIIQDKLDILVEEMNHLAKDIEEDTKSSAGDKYETSRAMANLEREKLYLQIMEYRKSIALLNSLTLSRSSIIGLGSLVKTNNEWIYLAISLGQLQVEKHTILVVSPVTPLGKEFMNKSIGDTVSFNNKSYKVIDTC